MVKANALDRIQEPIRTGINFLAYNRNHYLNNFFTAILKIGPYQATFERIDWIWLERNILWCSWDSKGKYT
jgi:hypothetical protein